MARPKKLYTITWQGKDYELSLSAIANLTDRSRTFIDHRLADGYTMQQIVDLNPGDIKFKKPRRLDPRGGNWNIDQRRKIREEEARKAHSDAFKQFLGGKPCCR